MISIKNIAKTAIAIDAIYRFVSVVSPVLGLVLPPFEGTVASPFGGTVYTDVNKREYKIIVYLPRPFAYNSILLNDVILSMY